MDVDIEDGVAAMDVFCGIGIDGKRVGKKVVNVVSVEWRAEELEFCTGIYVGKACEKFTTPSKMKIWNGEIIISLN